MPLPPFDHRGLLPHDVHPATLDDLRERCVDSFAGSSSRSRILGNFCLYRGALQRLGLHITQWIDGSFVDQTRLNPGDIDVVNFLDTDELRRLPRNVRKDAMFLLSESQEVRATYETHAFLVVTFDPGHEPWSVQFEAERKEKRDWFSQSRRYRGEEKGTASRRGRKGLVQLTLGHASLCPVIDSHL